MEVNPYREDMSSPPESDGGATDNGAPSANIPQPSPPRPSGENLTTPARAAPCDLPARTRSIKADATASARTADVDDADAGAVRPDAGAHRPAVIVAEGEAEGWFDPSRDGGFVRRAAESYLPTPSDAFVPPHLVSSSGFAAATGCRRRWVAIIAGAWSRPR